MLNERQQKALAALLSHSTLRSAAHAAGLAERTVRHYLQQPEFKKIYRELCQELIEDAARQGKQQMTKAFATLEEVMRSGDTDAARVSAARATVEFALKLSEHSEVLERIADLEKRMEGDL